MRVVASLKNYGRPARKMRDLISLVKGLPVGKALGQLAVVSRYGARDLEKLIKSAVANAKNNYGLREESLRVVDLAVGGGRMLKRWMPRAYGNANRILKRSCHLEIVLEGEEIRVVKNKKKELKKEDRGMKQEDIIITEEETDKKADEKNSDNEVKEQKREEIRSNWKEEEKEGFKEEKKQKVIQNWGKKVFRRKSF